MNAGTNQPANLAGVLSNVGYDANGNLRSETNVATGSGLTMTYDEANRVASATVSGGTEYYGYAPDNKRIYKMHTDGSEEWTFYGAKGGEAGDVSVGVELHGLDGSDDLLVSTDGGDDECMVCG